MKWSSRGLLVTLHIIALRPILAQFKSKSDSHISLVRDEIYSNPCSGPLYMPSIRLGFNGRRLFWSGT